MKRFLSTLATFALAGALAVAPPALADDDDEDDTQVFKVTVTNLTRGQVFTPLLLASHRAGLRLFTAGERASEEMAILAESGDVRPLAGALSADPRVGDVTAADDALPPGQSVTLYVDAGGRFNRVSLAGMLVPTNDAFVGLTDVRGPRGGRSVRLRVPAYDAGSEANDEDCANIPGPPDVCNGIGVSPDDDGEGFVHIHAGIHGIGGLDEAERDWRNPVAQVVIRRLNR